MLKLMYCNPHPILPLQPKQILVRTGWLVSNVQSMYIHKRIIPMLCFYPFDLWRTQALAPIRLTYKKEDLGKQINRISWMILYFLFIQAIIPFIFCQKFNQYVLWIVDASKSLKWNPSGRLKNVWARDMNGNIVT